jgi:hypothetical protein
LEETVLKLLIMLVAFLGVALALLGLRQHRMELTSESVKIYDQIRERNESLLDQRAQIARNTNPWSLAATLKDAGVNTGAALRGRDPEPHAQATKPQVETDLVAPLMDRANSGRLR